MNITLGANVTINGAAGQVVAIGRPPRGSKRITADTQVVVRLGSGAIRHALAADLA